MQACTFLAQATRLRGSHVTTKCSCWTSHCTDKPSPTPPDSSPGGEWRLACWRGLEADAGAKGQPSPAKGRPIAAKTRWIDGGLLPQGPKNATGGNGEEVGRPRAVGRSVFNRMPRRVCLELAGNFAALLFPRVFWFVLGGSCWRTYCFPRVELLLARRLVML